MLLLDQSDMGCKSTWGNMVCINCDESMCVCVSVYYSAVGLAYSGTVMVEYLMYIFSVVFVLGIYTRWGLVKNCIQIWVSYSSLKCTYRVYLTNSKTFKQS